MANISPAEHSHGIDLESALDFLNTLHPGHGRTDEQHQRDEHLASSCSRNHMAASVGLAGGQWLLPHLVRGSAPPSHGALVAAAAWAMLAVQLAAAWPAHLARRIPPHLVSRSPSVRL